MNFDCQHKCSLAYHPQILSSLMGVPNFILPILSHGIILPPFSFVAAKEKGLTQKKSRPPTHTANVMGESHSFKLFCREYL